jgi:ubiquinol-cytochrome c reductase cytochrome b subunit
LLPFLITALLCVHLILLHAEGSSNPAGIEAAPAKITFHPYFTYKDSFVLTFTFF